MFNSTEKQASQLLVYFQKFQVTDLIGFAQILGVEEADNFIDFTTNILAAFWQENRIKRKQLLKLAKDIAAANSELVTKNEAEKIREIAPSQLEGEGD